MKLNDDRGSAMTEPEPYFRRATFLVSALGAINRRQFVAALGDLGLMPQHYATLARVADQGGISQQAVADAVGVRRSVMVGLVDHLEASGLLERRRHPADRRANALHLTAAGQGMLRRADAIAVDLEARLLSSLDEAETAEFKALLRRVADDAGLASGVHPSAEAP